jgi:putative addiction module killer protein
MCYPASEAFQVREYLLHDGTRPFAVWFLSLDAAAASKVQVAVARLELGNLSRVAWSRGIGEVRIGWGPGLRMYLAQDGPSLLLLLGGGSKRRQQRETEAAVARWEDYRRRRARGEHGA